MKKVFSYFVVTLLLFVWSDNVVAQEWLLPFGQLTNQPWEAKYVKALIGNNIMSGEEWYSPDFDDSSWDKISGPISNRSSCYFATAWEPDNSIYWIRRRFTMEAVDPEMIYWLYTRHDDGCKIYLNGHLIYDVNDVVSSDRRTELSKEQASYFREGENLIAVTVNNSGGSDAYVDFGIGSVVERGGIRYLGTCAYELVDRSLTEYTIMEGTTSINANLFSRCSSVKKITLPNSVLSIDDNAFYNCSSLVSLSLPDSLKSIGSDAFYNCSSLTSVSLPDGLKSIGSDAFYGCSQLKTIYNYSELSLSTGFTSYGWVAYYAQRIVNNPERVGDFFFLDGRLVGYIGYETDLTLPADYKGEKYAVGDNAFSYYGYLKSVTIPNTVSLVGDNAFYNCSSLTAVNFPESVTSIGSYAFRNCTALSSLSLPDGLTSINDYTFYYCTSLTSVSLPDGLKSIGSDAFYGCSQLKTIYNYSELSLSTGSTSYGWVAYYAQRIVNNPERVGDFFFLDGRLVGYIGYETDLTLPADYKGEKYAVGDYAFLYCRTIRNVAIPNSVTSIGRYAFEGCSSLASLSLPEGLTSINDYAFSNCSSLASLSLPDSLTSIRSHAFNGCSSLASITFPERLSYLGEHAFYNCSALTAIEIPEGVACIDHGTFNECRSLSSVVLPDGLESIENSAFANCSALDSVVIPSSVTSIAISAFHNCHSLASVTLSEKLVSLGESAFQNCSSLTSVSIPSGVTSIGRRAFYGCSQLSSINIPSKVTSIQDETFNNCQSLATVTLPEGLTSIRDYAFRYCSSLTSMNMPNSINSIADNAFEGCPFLAIGDGISYLGNCAYKVTNRRMTEYAIKEGTTLLYAGLFADCYNMTKVTIPSSVEAIGENAFINCTSLPVEDGIRYADCYAVEVTDKTLAEYALMDNVRFFGKELFRNCAAMTTVTLPSTITSIGNNMFNGCSALASVDIPSSVKTIEGGAFNGCSSLTAVTIPKSVTSIGNDAFHGCTSLTTMNVPSNVETVGSGVFSGCTSLTSVVLPEGLASINGSLFSGCSSLASVSIPKSVKSVGGSAFNGCTSLASLILPEGLTSIGEFAFQNCSSLDSINIPLQVETIGQYAFAYCRGLSSVTLPLDLKSVEDYTFGGCTGLTSVVLPDSLERMGSGVFSGCDSLVSVALPAALTSLGQSTFDGCSALERVSFPAGITYIPDYTLNGCSRLYTLEMYSNITGMGRSNSLDVGEIISHSETPFNLNLNSSVVIYVPEGCYNAYKELYYDNVVVDGQPRAVAITVDVPGTLGEEILNHVAYLREVNSLSVSGTLNDADKACINSNLINLVDLDLAKVNMGAVSGFGNKAIRSLVLPDNCKSVSGFEGRINLKTLNLPDGLEVIGGNCFKDCYRLTNVEMPENLRTVGASAFSGCSRLQEVVFKDSLKSIADQAFYGCGSLLRVEFPEGLLSIGNSAYVGCSDLQQVNFNRSKASIGEYAFMRCSALEDLKLSENLTLIAMQAFQNCSSLKDLVFGEHLTLIGRNAFEGCTSLNSLMLGDKLETIESRAFYGCSSLENVMLGENMTSIGDYAFMNCISIDTLLIPRKIRSIPAYTFNSCVGLTYINLPDSITSIGEAAFYGCRSLSAIKLPALVTDISRECFGGCTSLADISIPNDVVTVGYHAFYDCDSLRLITLPGALRYCDKEIFASANSLEKVICPAFFPPITNGDLIGNANNATLYVPDWTIKRYKLANNWNLFNAIEPINGVCPSSISVYTSESLEIPSEGLAGDYKPNMDIACWGSSVGKLITHGESSLELSSFSMDQTRDEDSMTSLMNYADLTADSVVTHLQASRNTWHFLSFPYDVKLSEVGTLGDWTVSRYDGQARANGDFNHTWVEIPYDSMLHVGEGYIWHSTSGSFSVPALDNANKNMIFASDARYIQLKDYPSSNEANAGWNLIGNPYPCYYDSRFMSFTSPITVRSGNSYAAYSPLDDSYILSPLEAFFVQCSGENNLIEFDANGRQDDNKPRTLSAYVTAGARSVKPRQVFNLYLTDGNYTDHTRFVVNEAASLKYEIIRDAAKFMSDDALLPQLFTVENKERLSINERPLADGEVALGVYVGTKGTHTISLETEGYIRSAILVDKYEGTETNLLADFYTFESEKGMFTARFVIRLQTFGSDGIEENEMDDVAIVSVAGGIQVETTSDADVYLYNAVGGLIGVKTGSHVAFDVPTGVYVIRIGAETYKVAVTK